MIRKDGFSRFQTSSLSQIEIDFDVERNGNRFAVHPGRLEFPFQYSLDRLLIQSKAKAAGDPNHLYGSVLTNHGVENNGSLKSGLTRLFGVFRNDLFQK